MGAEGEERGEGRGGREEGEGERGGDRRAGMRNERVWRVGMKTSGEDKGQLIAYHNSVAKS